MFTKNGIFLPGAFPSSVLAISVFSADAQSGRLSPQSQSAAPLVLAVPSPEDGSPSGSVSVTAVQGRCLHSRWVSLPGCEGTCLSAAPAIALN